MTNYKQSKKTNVFVYYKPACITCRKTLSEIDRMKKDFEKRDFFKDKLSEPEIKKILKISGLSAKDMLRKRDKMYKELKLEESGKSESQIIKLLAKYPGLIKRPIIISKGKIYVGKPDPKQLKEF